MKMSIKLCGDLGCVPPDFFMNSVQKVLNKEISLSNLVENYAKTKKIAATETKICEIAKVSSFNNLQYLHPERYDRETVKFFSNSMDKNKSVGESALKRYVEFVSPKDSKRHKKGAESTASTEELSVSSSEHPIESETTQEVTIIKDGHLEFVEVVGQYKLTQADLSRSKVFVILGQNNDINGSIEDLLSSQWLESVLFISDNDILFNFEKNLPSKSKLSSQRLYFEAKPNAGKKSQPFLKNVQFGLLFFRTIFTPPVKLLQSFHELDDVVARVCPPHAEVAVIAFDEFVLPPVHLPGLNSPNYKVRYIGSEKKIQELMKSIEKEGKKCETVVNTYNFTDL